MLNNKKFEEIKKELEEKNLADNGLVVIAQRVKRNNFWQSALFSPMKTGILTIKDGYITFYPIKKDAPDYDNKHSFSAVEVIIEKCNVSKFSNSPMLGVATIKYRNGNKDEFFFSSMLYYNTVKAIFDSFFNP